MRRLALVAALVVAFAGCGDKKDDSSSTSTPVKATTRVEVIESQGEGGFDARKIYKAEAPGVVTVVSLFGAEGGEGSGFVLNGEGEIVTNAHVVTTGEGNAIKRANEVYIE